ncbi:biotin--protein ligase 2 isoform X1 [Senna tora]|uniref:Biotin--protein ligase 2 isoform X1 n=1 Tax=Senna tora TaxID=362788 RepID=A0A834WIY1_9FABA|nr:biotin--protein ligase 2 isoform X1 [Senna tora]
MESVSLTHRHRYRSGSSECAAVDFASAPHPCVPLTFFSERGESSALVFITHSIHSLYTTIVAARQKRTIARGARRKGTAIVKPSLDIGECSLSSPNAKIEAAISPAPVNIKSIDEAIVIGVALSLSSFAFNLFSRYRTELAKVRAELEPWEKDLIEHKGKLEVASTENKLLHEKGLPSVDVKNKWPNDLYLNGLRVGGILCTSTNKSKKINVSVGIGLNVNNKKPTTCLNTGLREISYMKTSLDEEVMGLLQGD